MMKRVYKESSSLTNIKMPVITMSNWGERIIGGKSYILEVEHNMNYIDLEFTIEPTEDYITNNMFLDVYVYSVRNNNLGDIVYSREDVDYSQIGLHFDDIITNLVPDTELIFKYNFRLKTFKESIYKRTQNIAPISEHIIESSDKNIYVYKSCMIPELVIGTHGRNRTNGIYTDKFITETPIQTYKLSKETTSTPIVNINGLTLSEDYDYSISNGIILFNEVLPVDTLINVIYTSGSEDNGLAHKTFEVQNAKIRGVNSKKINELFVTEENNIGLYLEKPIADNFDVILLYNGLTLTINEDFIIGENRKEIILFKDSGDVRDSDIITLYYMSEYSTLTLNTREVTGVFKFQYQNFYENGYIRLEICSDSEFLNKIATQEIPYVDGRYAYDFSIILPDEGTYYVRGVNNKIINTINGVKYITKIGNGIKIIIK